MRRCISPFCAGYGALCREPVGRYFYAIGSVSASFDALFLPLRLDTALRRGVKYIG